MFKTSGIQVIQYLNIQFSDPQLYFESGMQFGEDTKADPSKIANIHKPVLTGLVIEWSGYGAETDKNIQFLNGWMPLYIYLSKTEQKHPLFKWLDLRNGISVDMSPVSSVFYTEVTVLATTKNNGDHTQLLTQRLLTH